MIFESAREQRILGNVAFKVGAVRMEPIPERPTTPAGRMKDLLAAGHDEGTAPVTNARIDLLVAICSASRLWALVGTDLAVNLLGASPDGGSPTHHAPLDLPTTFAATATSSFA